MYDTIENITVEWRILNCRQDDKTIDGRIVRGRYSIRDLNQVSYFNRKYYNSVQSRPHGIR